MKVTKETWWMVGISIFVLALAYVQTFHPEIKVWFASHWPVIPWWVFILIWTSPGLVALGFFLLRIMSGVDAGEVEAIILWCGIFGLIFGPLMLPIIIDVICTAYGIRCGKPKRPGR